MSAFIITSRGNVVGEYEADSPEDTLQAVAKDAGYYSLDDLCSASCSAHKDFEVFEVFEQIGK